MNLFSSFWSCIYIRKEKQLPQEEQLVKRFTANQHGWISGETRKSLFLLEMVLF